MARHPRAATASEKAEVKFTDRALVWAVNCFIFRPVHHVTFWLAVATIFTSGMTQIVLAVLTVLALIVLFWQRKRLKWWADSMKFVTRWTGTPGTVGLAEELGLVVASSRKIPKIVSRKFSDRGVDLIFDCPPGLSTAALVDKIPVLGEAMGAFEVSGEAVRGTSEVEVSLIMDDVLARDVAAEWVTAIDSPPLFTPDDRNPFAEGEIEFKGPKSSDLDPHSAAPYWDSGDSESPRLPSPNSEDDDHDPRH